MRFLFTLLLLFGFVTLAYTARSHPKISSKMAISTSALKDGTIGRMPMPLLFFKPKAKKRNPIAGKNAAYIKISKVGGALGHIQLYQQPFTLEKGTTYTYNLWSKSEKPRNVTMRIMHQGAPWNVYAAKSINLSEDWKEFFITFEMPVDDVSSRAGVIMGTEKVDVWLDHIRLYEGEYVSDIEGAEPQAVEPSGKVTITWAELKSED